VTAFDPRGAAAFRLLDAGYAEGVAEFRYQFDGGEVLCERVRFPGAPEIPAHRAAAFAAALDLAHGIIGISYYKAGVPPRIEWQRAPTPALAELLDELYLHGLGEFAHVNGLDLRGRIRFPRDAAGTEPMATALGLPRRSLVAIGGGKDSLVTIEALKRAGEPLCVAWIGHSELIRATAQATGQPLLNLERRIDPQLFDYNRAGAWNGHIPVTAINSSLLLLAALLYGYDAVVFSNEASASAPNLTHDGFAVNHQWSKGEVFERRLHDHVRAAVATDLRYWSYLRPYNELQIIGEFAKLSQYHGIFSSCNRNFRLLGERPESRWCGQCPKCLFTFLGLAPVLAKPALTAIFGRNLLDDASLFGAFDALIEHDGRHKPFECVGEAGEARQAFDQLAQRADWKEDVVVARYVREVAALPVG
jgi:UDP-N-acetyl-alpha-D-muramoyl-L-alanyl-L-glutamate epimerase